jgi:hypothetical protein
VKESKGVYRYRLKRTKDHPDSLDLKVHAVKGVLKLSADRLDLSDLQGQGPDSVTFTLSIGESSTSSTVKMGRKDSRWRYRYTTKGKVDVKGPPGGTGGGGGGGGGGGLPGGETLSVRNLGEGWTFAPTGFRTTVLRTQQEYDAEWWQRFPTPPPGSKAPSVVQPGVDFTKEMVVLIELGTRPTLGYRMSATGAKAVGTTGVDVEWEERKPGANCVVSQVVASPFLFAAVTRREGIVTFSGSVVTVNCP